jgi:hypothetical protein
MALNVGSILFNASGDISLANATTTGALSLTGDGDVQVGDLNSGGDLTVNSGGSMTAGDLIATGDALLVAGGDKESDQLCLELSLVKWGRNERGKIVIEKKDELKRRGINSPDYADSLMLTNIDPPPQSVMTWEELRI